jgi:hypothetical protein
VREVHDEIERRVTIIVDNALPAPVARALDAGERLREDGPTLDALERAVSLAASHAAATSTPAGASRWSRAACRAARPRPGHLARMLRELALLPATTEASRSRRRRRRRSRAGGRPPGSPPPGAPMADHVLEGLTMRFAATHKTTSYLAVAFAFLAMVGGGTVSPLLVLGGALGLIAVVVHRAAAAGTSIASPGCSRWSPLLRASPTRRCWRCRPATTSATAAAS